MDPRRAPGLEGSRQVRKSGARDFQIRAVPKGGSAARASDEGQKLAENWFF
jgi:hypothetical protein